MNNENYNMNMQDYEMNQMPEQPMQPMHGQMPYQQQYSQPMPYQQQCCQPMPYMQQECCQPMPYMQQECCQPVQPCCPPVQQCCEPCETTSCCPPIVQKSCNVVHKYHTQIQPIICHEHTHVCNHIVTKQQYIPKYTCSEETVCHTENPCCC